VLQLKGLRQFAEKCQNEKEGYIESVLIDSKGPALGSLCVVNGVKEEKGEEAPAPQNAVSYRAKYTRERQKVKKNLACVAKD
jgi:hypothetical protein